MAACNNIIILCWDYITIVEQVIHLVVNTAIITLLQANATDYLLTLVKKEFSEQ